MPGPARAPAPPPLRRHPWRLELRLAVSPASSTSQLQETPKGRARKAPVSRPPLPLPHQPVMPRYENTPNRPRYENTPSHKPSTPRSSHKPTRPLPPPVLPHRSSPHMGVGAILPPPQVPLACNNNPSKVMPPNAIVPGKAGSPVDGIPLLYRLNKSVGIWKFSDMDRFLAQCLLRFAPTGCFIVRKGSQEGTLALTVRNKTENDCDHYRIFLRGGGLQIEGSLLAFNSVETLIEYYSLHLREMPYLLRLPHPVNTITSIALIEKYSQMRTAFWTAFYPRPMGEAPAATHLNLNHLNADPVKRAASHDTGLGTGSASLELPRISYLSMKEKPAITDPRFSTHALSGASSVDSLLRSSDDRTATSPEGDCTGSSLCAMQLTATSTSRSADDLCRGEEPEPEPVCDRTSSFRSSVTVRLGRSQSDVPSNYDAMWNTRTGATLPSVSSSSVSSASVPFPPMTPPQDACPMAPPSGIDLDLAHVPGFPQPERFKQVFTFDGYTPKTARRGPRPPHPPPRSPPGTASDVYEDPLDLRIGAASHAGRQLQQRWHALGPQASVPLGGLPTSSSLRAAVSDDSLSRRVEPSLQEIHDSVAAMEAELDGPPVPPPLPPHGRVVLRPRPIPLSSSEYPTPSAPPQLDASLRQRRDSVYDNVVCDKSAKICDDDEGFACGASSHPPSRQPSVASNSSRGTVFSAPWDNSLWHQVLHPAARGSATSMDALRLVAAAERAKRGGTREEATGEDADGDATPTRVRRSLSTPSDNGRTTPTGQKAVTLGPDDVLHSVEEPDSGHDLVRKAQARLSEFIQPSGGRNVGASIDRWLHDLTQRADLMFGQKVTYFIECTRDASEKNPHAVMRNIRQFMDGLKHYLVQRAETGFQKVVENERKKLAPDEFLNVERRLESALYNLILRPLKGHVDRLVSEWQPNVESLRKIRENLQLAAEHSPERLGIRSGLQPPQEVDLTRIRQYFTDMEEAYSPLVKLECLLKAVEIMYDGNENQEGNKASPQLVSTDDLMPIFTYVMVRCNLYNAEIEADYMQGLLASKFLLGEGAYYLSTLQAAVQVIKNFHRRASIGPMSTSYEDLSQLHGVLRVIVLDERTDSTNIKTFPARPTMTARDLSILIAHRCHIFNPQDFGLYHFSNGKERHLNDLDLPHQIKLDCEAHSDKPCHLLYRRTNGVFALPLGLSCVR